MLKTVIIVLVALIAGAVAGSIICGGVNKGLRQRVRSLRKELAGEKTRIGTMDMIIGFMFTVLTIFVIVILIMFWYKGVEPSTLITCVFGIFTAEFGVLGWIKTTKDKQATKVQEPPEPPVEREEPPDVGV